MNFQKQIFRIWVLNKCNYSPLILPQITQITQISTPLISGVKIYKKQFNFNLCNLRNLWHIFVFNMFNRLSSYK